jgi:hypothetical protein
VEVWRAMIVLVTVAWSAIGFAAPAGSIRRVLLEQHDPNDVRVRPPPARGP